MTRASLDKRPAEVAAMFDGVAARYDRTNTILSFGQDRLWRKATRLALDLQPGDEVLVPAYTFPATANVVVEPGRKSIDVSSSPLEQSVDPPGTMRTLVAPGGTSMYAVTEP